MILNQACDAGDAVLELVVPSMTTVQRTESLTGATGSSSLIDAHLRFKQGHNNTSLKSFNNYWMLWHSWRCFITGLYLRWFVLAKCTIVYIPRLISISLFLFFSFWFWSVCWYMFSSSPSKWQTVPRKILHLLHSIWIGLQMCIWHHGAQWTKTLFLPLNVRRTP